MCRHFSSGAGLEEDLSRPLHTMGRAVAAPGTASTLERPELQRGCVRSYGVTYSSAGLSPLALCLFFKFILSSFLIPDSYCLIANNNLSPPIYNHLIMQPCLSLAGWFSLIHSAAKCSQSEQCVSPDRGRELLHVVAPLLALRRRSSRVRVEKPACPPASRG